MKRPSRTPRKTQPTAKRPQQDSQSPPKARSQASAVLVERYPKATQDRRTRPVRERASSSKVHPWWSRILAVLTWNTILIAGFWGGILFLSIWIPAVAPEIEDLQEIQVSRTERALEIESHNLSIVRESGDTTYEVKADTATFLPDPADSTMVFSGLIVGVTSEDTSRCFTALGDEGIALVDATDSLLPETFNRIELTGHVSIHAEKLRKLGRTIIHASHAIWLPDESILAIPGPHRIESAGMKAERSRAAHLVLSGGGGYRSGLPKQATTTTPTSED